MPVKVAELSQQYPTSCSVLRFARRRYALWNWLRENGYIVYRLAGRRIYEHRAVAALMGAIPDGYHIHHIDGTRTNNDASNLMVLSPGDHARLHLQGARRQCVCPVCEEKFYTTESQIARRETLYCSATCAYVGRRKVDRPTEAELARLLASVGNWTRIGRMFGVSDNSIRKWAKAYGLNLSIDGRKRNSEPAI